jgi:signal transduction histidine kinase
MVFSEDPGLSSPANRVLLVLGQTPFPVELLDDQFRVLYCNHAYTQSFVGPSKAVLDQTSGVFPGTMVGGASRREIFDVAANTGLWKGESTVRTVEGTEVPVRIIVFPIQHPADLQVEYAVFYEDIQEEVATRRALVHQQNLVAIRSRQAQMGELLSMIAHQWRQPLTVLGSLVGNIQLKAQLGTVVPEYLAAKLDRMNQTIQFLSDTIDSFRNFYMPAKFKADEDLVVLCRQAYDLVAPSLEKIGAVVEWSLPSSALVCKVFSGEFLQLVLELFTNARDAFGPQGLVEPRVRVEVADEGPMAVVRVGNNGSDIPADVLPFIWDPYYTTKEGGSGAGLGLYMAKLIVETHHLGSLQASSQDGWTEFVCRLPRDGAP